MERKHVERFTYDGLGFPIVLVDISLVNVWGIWTPAIDYNKLQKTVLLELSQKPGPLTGNEVHFIRIYFEMSLEVFGKHLEVTQAIVLNWEKAKNKSAKISPEIELSLRLFVILRIEKPMLNQINITL